MRSSAAGRHGHTHTRDHADQEYTAGSHERQPLAVETPDTLLQLLPSYSEETYASMKTSTILLTCTVAFGLKWTVGAPVDRTMQLVTTTTTAGVGLQSHYDAGGNRLLTKRDDCVCCKKDNGGQGGQRGGHGGAAPPPSGGGGGGGGTGTCCNDEDCNPGHNH